MFPLIPPLARRTGCTLDVGATLDWHRRENKRVGGRLSPRRLDDEDLLDEAPLAGLRFIERVAFERQLCVERYAFEKQETEVAAEKICFIAKKIGSSSPSIPILRTVDSKR